MLKGESETILVKENTFSTFSLMRPLVKVGTELQDRKHMAVSALPNYTKLDTNGKEIIYWVALGTCGHITLYSLQCFDGDEIFCMRCNGPSTIQVAKFMRPQAFINKYGGDLIT